MTIILFRNDLVFYFWLLVLVPEIDEHDYRHVRDYCASTHSTESSGQPESYSVLMTPMSAAWSTNTPVKIVTGY